MIRHTPALLLAATLLATPTITFTAWSAAAASPAEAATMATGAIVYDMYGKEIGTVVDVLTNSHNDKYAVLNVRLYIGRDKMIMVPVDHIGGTPDHMTMEATKTQIMRIPALVYNMPSGGH